jgi:murein DD-endopeptidase MepM/ murein hydrolase activator NlpD
MAYRNTPKVQFPLEHYQVNGLPFGKRSVLDGVLWGIHLGEDIMVKAGTDVCAIGRGTVVYAAFHAGDAEKGNWGHVIIIRHRHPKRKQVFYSLYGHLGTSYKRIGDTVDIGEPLGFIGEGYTAENGFWEAHLHFAVYTGPWQKHVLPGYWKDGDTRTRPEWWVVPSEFIANYNTEN